LAAQDDARENRLVDLFNLTRPVNRVRHGTDALLLIDGHELEFELKSVTTAGSGISTVRDFGPGHISKWKNKHWLFSSYDGTNLVSCRYGSPSAMAPWIAKTWEYIRRDFEMAQVIPALITMDTMTGIIGDKPYFSLADAKALQKKQYDAAGYKARMDIKGGYSRERMLELFRDRAKYVIERGSTLNNPHISPDYFKGWPEITKDHASALRALVKEWLDSVPVAQTEQADTP